MNRTGLVANISFFCPDFSHQQGKMEKKKKWLRMRNFTNSSSMFATL